MSAADQSTPGAQAANRTAFSFLRVALASIKHGWRVSLAVAMGVATAAAVIIGALLVGDSMRGSLRGLTVERLGKTESAVVPGAFFDIDGITTDEFRPVALILFASGVVESRAGESGNGSSGDLRRAGSVQVIGCDESFWQLDVSGVTPKEIPSDDGVVLNQAAADELQVEIGDMVTVRLPVEQAVPADSPLGRRDIQTEGLPRMKVLDIIADRGIGRLSLAASQASPQNIFVNRETIADVLDRNGQANTLLFDSVIDRESLNVDITDLGLKLERVQQQFTAGDGSVDTIFDYYSITSDRLMLPEAAVERVVEKVGAESATAVMTYLANAIERLDKDGNVVASVPYSTLTAIDSTEALPLRYDALTVQRKETAESGDAIAMVINDWTATQLDAQPGTPLRVAYYEPEVEKGKEIERYFDAIVSDIVPVTAPATPYRRRRPATFDQPPTVYNDPHLTPTVPGVTDQDSISDWDLPFQLTREISDADDSYWENYRLTPKAFIPLADGQRLFGSRFGQTTGLRIAATAAPDVEALSAEVRQSLSPILDELGWSVRPIRQQQLAASSGTTPFDALFLSLSFFVILAAVMLIAMLFRLGLVQRLKQFGTLLAVGWTPRRVASLALVEGVLVAAVGVLLGIVGGIGYAVFVLWALRNWWVGAVTVPFLTFHWTPTSLFIGAAASWLVAVVTIAWTARSLKKAHAQTLLSGRDTDQQQVRTSKTADRSAAKDKLPMVAGAMAVLAIIVAAAGAVAGGQAAAGGFVGGGMMLLFASLIWIFSRLRRPRRIESSGDQKTLRRFSLGGLASRNASRHPLRSTLTVGLMASAAFLIIAITAFRLQPTERGTGGFDLVGQTATPVLRDLSDPAVQSELLGPDARELTGAQIVPIRLRPGQDASCNNLYQAAQPTVLGIPESFGPIAQFDWASHAPVSDDESPWQLLHADAKGTAEDPIAVIIDQNTAMWSLQMRGGVGEVKSFEYESGRQVYFRVVGLLSNSVLQGRLMIGESNFEKQFAHISGYRFFLVGGAPERTDAIASTLENRLGDVGMDVSDAGTVLAGMLAVQNTYLRTFQSLGALGLLLGTIGLAVSQLRSIYERRQELAVMRAMGFTRRRLAAFVMSETASLLLTGIGCGVLCAIFAVFPYAVLSGLKPPVIEPLVVVVGIILFGMLAGLFAVRSVVRMPLLESLRGE